MDTKFKIKLPFMKHSSAAKKTAQAHHIRLGKDPYFDWTVILALFISMTILCVSFALVLWHTASGGFFDSTNAASDDATVAAHSLNVSGLQNIITVQTQKSSAVSQYENGYAGPADPSL